MIRLENCVDASKSVLPQSEQIQLKMSMASDCSVASAYVALVVVQPFVASCTVADVVVGGYAGSVVALGIHVAFDSEASIADVVAVVSANPLLGSLSRHHFYVSCYHQLHHFERLELPLRPSPPCSSGAPPSFATPPPRIYDKFQRLQLDLGISSPVELWHTFHAPIVTFGDAILHPC